MQTEKTVRDARRRLEKPRAYCQQPEGCVAGKRGGCRLCHGAKMSAASKAALADPAVRAKMSAASKAALADPAVRAKMSAASKTAWADPAVRAKMSAASKAASQRRRKYVQLRREGVTREDALQRVGL